STQTLAAISPVIEIAKPATRLLAGSFERVKLLSLDTQKIVVPEVFAGHTFDAEDAFLLCHAVQPSARILSRAARDESGSGQAAGLGDSSRRPSSRDRLALPAPPSVAHQWNKRQWLAVN